MSLESQYAREEAILTEQWQGRALRELSRDFVEYDAEGW